jgi:ACR3 family arsenite efflux pump ArsB
MIWLLASVAELVVLARVIVYLRFIADASPVAGVSLVWSVVALVGIPLAAWFVTRMLRREYRGSAGHTSEGKR